MTYCVSLCLNEGMVFLSDTRTNAGVDQVGSFRKMALFQSPDRFFVMQSSGNLAITQAVKEFLSQGTLFGKKNLWNVQNAYEAAEVVGAAIRKVYDRDSKALLRAGIEFNCQLNFGGQIKGEVPRLFQHYSAGNFIESTPETCYFQIGESKYGKPILDRVVKTDTPINLATKCALVSMDSTLKSNISVGLPLDLIIYKTNEFKPFASIAIDNMNPYFKLIHQEWGNKLKQAIMEIPDPEWSATSASPNINQAATSLKNLPIFSPKKDT